MDPKKDEQKNCKNLNKHLNLLFIKPAYSPKSFKIVSTETRKKVKANLPTFVQYYLKVNYNFLIISNKINNKYR